MDTNFIGILLPTTPSYTVASGFSTSLYDAAGAQTITVQAGANLDLRGTLGANTIRLHGNAAEWQSWRDGSTAILIHTNGDRVQLPAQLDAQTCVFDDGTAALRIDTSGSQAQVMLGATVLTSTAAAVSVQASGNTGSTMVAPWSLVAPESNGSKASTSYGVLLSDGTATGTALLSTRSAVAGMKTNADQTRAAFTVGNGYNTSTDWIVTDGRLASTHTIASGLASPYGYVPVDWGDYVVLLPKGPSEGGSAQAAISDWTETSARTANIPTIVSWGGDLVAVAAPASQSLWYPAATGPYGSELIRLGTASDGSLTSTLVRDINPGTGSSFSVGPFSGAAFEGAALADGRLVFGADDGTGREPWVSDGSLAGTYKLANLDGSISKSGGDSVSQFVSIGDRAVFVANIGRLPSGTASSLGTEIVVTDGTSAGTQVLDIAPGSTSSSPQILGQSNGQVYFLTASALYRTDSYGFEKLVELPPGSTATLLGRTDQKVYVALTSPMHGTELWVGDFAANTLTLVKDFVAGSGSGLASHTGQITALAGDKLVFSAYESATELALFITDGTEAGTFKLSSSLPDKVLVLSSTLIVFSGPDGVSAAQLSDTAPPLVSSLSGVPVGSPFQRDNDQVFFRTDDGGLYSSRGSPDTTVKIASNVAQFKLVADDALYFVQSSGGGSTITLWYSDGTAAGTRFISDLPNGSYDLANAVGLRTGGTPPPQDTAAPSLLRASVNGDKLTLLFSDANALDAQHAPAATDFSVTGTQAAIAKVSVDGTSKTVILTMSAGVLSTDVIRVSYADPTSADDTNAIQDTAGNDAAGFAGRFVVNQTADNVAPTFAGATVNGSVLTLSFSDAGLLDGTNLPSLSTFTLSGTDATVSGLSVDATARTVTMTLSKAVSGTDVISVTYTDAPGNDVNAIQDAAGNDAATLSAAPVTNLTPIKAPWTLLVPTYQGLFRSDGTAQASGFTVSSYSPSSVETNQDQTKAVWLVGRYNSTGFYEYSAYGILDSSSTPALLAQGISIGEIYKIGSNIVVSDGGGSLNGLVTDGTAAGSTLVADLPSGILDLEAGNIWSFVSTAPYGTELFRTSVSDRSVSTGMVKDIYPGAQSSSSWWSGSPAVLSGGRLVFAANDGVNGSEPWVSDGTVAGTFMLKDLWAGSDGGASQFTSAGSEVAFRAYASAHGLELVFTDGTSMGTRLLDIEPGAASSDPTILGVAAGKVYFTATVSGKPAIYSSDGTSFAKLADINNAATLLGWTPEKAFFKISDSVHGEELWAADLANGGLALVSDILPGSGSALAGNSNTFVAAGKLVFQAYTSATQQGLFVSDGTANGTAEIGGLVSGQKLIRNTMVFSDTGAAWASDLSAATPTRVQLVGAPISATGIQSDSDQAFFTTSGGDLYVTGGTLETTTKLASSVVAFKVVAENAVYFVESAPTATGYELVYSDGTAAGTRDVAAAPSSIVSEFSRAVAIETIGVPQNVL